MRIAVLAVALAVLGAGLASFALRGPTEEAARAAIDELFARRQNAVEARDLDAYLSTVDPARTFLRECERQRYEVRVRSDSPRRGYSVARIDRWGDYFRVWVSTDFGVYRTFMRHDGGRWYLSEPYPRELGERLTKEYAGVKLRYNAADSDLASAVGADLETIMATILPHAAEAPAQLFDMQIATLSNPAGDCFVLGAAERVGTTLITLVDVRLTPTYDHISRDTFTTIEHEALHWLQDDHATRIRLQRLPPWWVIEGWPSLITDPPSQSARRYAICTAPPSYDDLRLGLRVDASIEEVEDAYVVAAMLVDRVTGLSDNAAYWRFFDEFGGSTDPYLRATGSDGRTFYDAWLGEARGQYC